MSHIFINNNKTPNGDIIDIDIYLNDDVGDYNFRLLELQPFQYGSDDDKETISFPGSAKLSFTIQSDSALTISEFDSLYHSIIDKINVRNPPATVLIKKNGAAYFKGYIDPEYQNSVWNRGEIEINVIHVFDSLRIIDPRTDPVNYYGMGIGPGGIHDPGPNGEYLYKYMIVDLLKLVDDTIDEEDVLIYCPIKCYTSFTFLGTPWPVPAENFGGLLGNFFQSNCLYENCLDVIKEIIGIWGAEAIYKEGKFIIRSRNYYSGAQLKMITDMDYKKDGAPQIYEMKKIKGLEITFRYGSGFISNYKEDYGECPHNNSTIIGADHELTYPDQTEQLQLTNDWGGHLPPGDLSGTVKNLNVYVPDYIAGIGNGGYYESLPDEFFTDTISLRALWSVIGTMLWDLVEGNRYVYNVEMENTDWDYASFFYFENYTNKKFRAKKIEVDEMNNSTKMLLAST